MALAAVAFGIFPFKSVSRKKIAHARTGTKGNNVNIWLIAYKEDDDSLLEERVTAERITEFFASVITRPVALLHPGTRRSQFYLAPPGQREA